MNDRLPSPWIQVLSVRSGAIAVPLASCPWHAVQVPPASWPWKILSPSAICAAVPPPPAAGLAAGFAAAAFLVVSCALAVALVAVSAGLAAVSAAPMAMAPVSVEAAGGAASAAGGLAMALVSEAAFLLPPPQAASTASVPASRYVPVFAIRASNDGEGAYRAWGVRARAPNRPNLTGWPPG